MGSSPCSCERCRMVRSADSATPTNSSPVAPHGVPRLEQAHDGVGVLAEAWRRAGCVDEPVQRRAGQAERPAVVANVEEEAALAEMRIVDELGRREDRKCFDPRAL